MFPNFLLTIVMEKVESREGEHKLVMKSEILLQEGRTLMKKTDDIVEKTRLMSFEKKKDRLSP